MYGLQTPFLIVSKQALSKARQRISYKAFLALFRLSVEQYYHHFQKLRLWNGFHIYAVNGSTIQIPESEENLQVFGGNPNKTGKISPLASVSALYDVMNDMLLDVTLNAYRYDERNFVKKHLSFLPDFPNSIVLFDRGYLRKAIFEQEDILFTLFSFGTKEIFTLRSLHFIFEDGSTEYFSNKFDAGTVRSFQGSAPVWE